MIDNVRKPARKSKPSSKLERLDLEILGIVNRHWLTLLVFVVLGWAGAMIYALLTPPTYESRSSVMLIPKDQNLAVRGYDTKTDSTQVSDDLFASHMMTVQSPRLVKTALEKKGLLELPSLLEKKHPNDLSTANTVIRNLYINRGGDGQTRDAQVMRIAFRHSNQADAQLVVQAIMDEFMYFLDIKFKDKNKEAADIIEKAKTDLEQGLAESREKFNQFQLNTPILFSPDHSTNIYRMQYEQMQTALTSLRLERSEVAARLDMVERQLKEIDAKPVANEQEKSNADLERMSLIDDKSAQRVGIFLQIFFSDAQTANFQEDQPVRFAQARSQYDGLLALRSKEKTLLDNYGANHPDVRAVQQQIKEVESFLNEQAKGLSLEGTMVTPDKIVEGYVRLMRNDIAEFDMREKQLIEESAEAERMAKELIQFELEGESLRFAMEKQQDLYDATIDRLRDINLGRDYGGYVNEILEDATVGEEVWPSNLICLALGTIAGLGFGSLIVTGLELRNRTLRNSREIEQITGAPILSYIPKFESFRGRTYIAKVRASGVNVNPIVYTVHSPQSQESEIFRGLRTSLFFRSGDLDKKVIAVTSSNSGDGKSTITANLVTSMALAGRKVLLIECDLRKPAVAALLGVEAEKGLSEYLTAPKDLDSFIVHSPVENLDVLPAGQRPENPAELLATAEFKKLLDEVAERYEVVILDCPPVLAVSDPCIVADVADGVLMVVRINPRSRVELQRCTGMLSDVEANILGVVLNASHLEDEGSVGKGGSMVGYGYGTYGENNRDYYLTPSTNGSSKKS